MKTYQGGCHCGKVRFEADIDLSKVTGCNCSICSKKGSLNLRVPPGHFRLLSGQDALTLYQFGLKIAKHWFCKYCGIHTFWNPRAARDQYSINVRCLDDFEAEKPNIEVKVFDGRNWEETIKTFKF